MGLMLADFQADGRWPNENGRLKRVDKKKTQQQQSKILRKWALMTSGLLPMKSRSWKELSLFLKCERIENALGLKASGGDRLFIIVRPGQIRSVICYRYHVHLY